MVAERVKGLLAPASGWGVWERKAEASEQKGPEVGWFKDELRRCGQGGEDGCCERPESRAWLGTLGQSLV